VAGVIVGKGRLQAESQDGHLSTWQGLTLGLETSCSLRLRGNHNSVPSILLLGKMLELHRISVISVRVLASLRFSARAIMFRGIMASCIIATIVNLSKYLIHNVFVALNIPADGFRRKVHHGGLLRHPRQPCNSSRQLRAFGVYRRCRQLSSGCFRPQASAVAAVVVVVYLAYDSRWIGRYQFVLLETPSAYT
jgi:hypothetical protein